MSYDQKVQSAREVIETHNGNVPDKSQVDFDKFLSELQSAGGTTENALAVCSWEDLEKTGLPRLLARQISREFRSSGDKNDGKSRYVSAKKAEQLTVKELVERYDPSDVDNAVGKRLKSLSKGKECIVLKDDNNVNVEKSVELIQSIRDGYESIDKIVIDGIPKKVYKIGERPDIYTDENPIYPGRTLRINQMCDQTSRSWEGVPITVRQLLHIAVSKTKELKINSLDNAHSAIDRALQEDAEGNIRRRYPNASIEFDMLKEQDNLPSLKVLLDSSTKGKNSSTGDNPFVCGDNTIYYSHKRF